MKFYTNTQTINPPRPGREKYQVPIIDDYTRYTEGPYFRTKDKITEYIIKFCKRQKLLRGRYLAIQRINGGSEFYKFQIQGESEGIIFKLTPIYTPKPNSVAERIGGYINQIQRTINIDTKLLDSLQPFYINTAIYIYNRLVNPKTGKTLIITQQ